MGFGLHELFRNGPIYALGEGLHYGLALGLMGFLLSVLLEILQVRKDPKEVLEPVEHPKWSWRRSCRHLFAWEHLKIAVALGTCVALIVGLGFLIRAIELQQEFAWPLEGARVIGYGIGTSLIALCNHWLQQGYRGGLPQEFLPESKWLEPNQRIRSSVHNALLIAGISALLNWLMYALSYKIRADTGGVWPQFAFPFGILFGLSAGVLTVLLYGGMACLRHLVLRMLLWRTHVFPWNATSFLNDATARILLRRVGAGYSFTHRLLMEHFADLDREPSFTLGKIGCQQETVPKR